MNRRDWESTVAFQSRVGVVKRISTYDEDFFNNALVAKRYIVSFLLHDPTFLTKPPLSMD